MSKLKSLANETLVYGLGSMLPKIINFIFIASYLTRVTSQEEFGIYGIMYAWSSLLLTIYTFRMETTFFRFGKEKGQRDKVFFNISLLVLGITLFFSLLIGLNSKNIASFLTRPEDNRFVIYFLFIVAFDALSAVPFAKLRLENRAKKFALLKIINVLIIAGITYFFLGLLPSLVERGSSWAGEWYDPAYELDYVFLSNLVASGVVLLLLSPAYRSFKPVLDTALIKKILKYAYPLFIVAIAGVISTQLDRFLIKEWAIGDIDTSGIYNAVIKIAVLMSIFTTAFNYAAEPFFFKNAKEGKTTQLYGSVALAYTITACFLFLTISMFLDQIQILIGADFRSGLDVVPILSFAFLILGIFYNFSIWYKLADKTKYGAMIAVVGAIISLVVNYFLIPTYGIYGAAYTALLSYTAMVGLTYYLGQLHYPIDYPIKKIIGYLALAAGIYVIFYYFKPMVSELYSFLLALIMVFLYASICYLIEWKHFKKVLTL